MQWIALCVLLGMSLAASLTVLPPWWFTLFCLIITLLLSIVVKRKWWRCVALTIAAASWLLLYSAFTLQHHLARNFNSVACLVTGTIVTIPEQHQSALQFQFHIEKINQCSVTLPLPLTARINWYHELPNVNVGDRWQFMLKLKPNHGNANPGGFDYEKWLFVKGIDALGSVVNDTHNQLLSASRSTHAIDTVRNILHQRMQQAIGDQTYSGMIMGLTLGIRDQITQEQWQVFRRTGTIHLMAIAGLHIGLIVSFMKIFTEYIWRRFPKLILLMARPTAAGLMCLIAAFIYSAMAGFALPTVRALIMLSVYLGCIFFRRYQSPWHAILLAMLLMLLIHPTDIFDDGFWLSFGAVAVILYTLCGRLGTFSHWQQWLQIQWALCFGLLPLMLLLFQQVSLVSPLANLIAIPYVGFLIMPLSIIGCLLLFPCFWLAKKILGLALVLLHLLWPVLTLLANFSGSVWQQAIFNPGILICSVIGIILLLAPRGFPSKVCGAFWLSLLFLARAPQPAIGSVQLTLLDVGQGLSVFIQTAHHRLLYDTGAKFSAENDMGLSVILPFLLQNSVKQLDRMIISHGDNDHIGGARAIINNIRVDEILTSVPEKLLPSIAHHCYAGQHWVWDQVDFVMLHPPGQQQHYYINDSSCVLRITAGGHSILLTGDIEKFSEAILLQDQMKNLRADILIAPHHGSKTSSTQEFIKAVAPHWVLFAVGFQNRFHFPNQKVLIRYRTIAAKLLDTAQNGAISMEITAQGVVHENGGYRTSHRHFW